MREIFFTADTHFGHRNIITFCARPFADVAHMDDKMVRAWNDKVGPGDLVYHLGDVSFHKDPLVTFDILMSLNGRKQLIAGNHDGNLPKYVLDVFDRVLPYKMIEVGGTLVTMCHFPMMSWMGARTQGWMLHGHTHGSIDDLNKGVRRHDVGVDVNQFAPVTLEEIMLAKMGESPGNPPIEISSARRSLGLPNVRG